jgi:hypothetical protein
MIEQWSPIPGWPAYEASDHGRIRSVDREVRGPNGSIRRLRGKVLTPVLINCGRQTVVTLYRSGRGHSFAVARLVAMTFLGEPPSPTSVAGHLDGDPANNRPGNIHWTHMGVQSGADREARR